MPLTIINGIISSPCVVPCRCHSLCLVVRQMTDKLMKEAIIISPVSQRDWIFLLSRHGRKISRRQTPISWQSARVPWVKVQAHLLRRLGQVTGVRIAWVT